MRAWPAAATSASEAKRSATNCDSVSAPMRIRADSGSSRERRSRSSSRMTRSCTFMGYALALAAVRKSAIASKTPNNGPQIKRVHEHNDAQDERDQDQRSKKEVEGRVKPGVVCIRLRTCVSHKSIILVSEFGAQGSSRVQQICWTRS